jgi:hypothetical protein
VSHSFNAGNEERGEMNDGMKGRVVPGIQPYISDFQIYKSLVRHEKRLIIREQGGRCARLHETAHELTEKKYTISES